MDTPGDDELRQRSKRLLDAAIEARRKLTKQEVVYYGHAPNTAGLLFINYANMILNRNVDLFDDALFLLNADRLSSACIIARCVMETHAVGMFAWDEAGKALTKDGPEEAGKKILRFINSSRFKMEEQKALKAGKFDLADYKFTEEAKDRMLQESAQSIHVLNAMRFLFELELNMTGFKESQNELIYNALSEWVHPSQTSLLHKYAVDTHRIDTSFGTVTLFERMRHECAGGLKLIQYSGNLHRDMIEFGKKLHQIEVAEPS